MSLTVTEGLAKAMRYCAYRERCHKEVRTKLLDLGMRGEELEQVMSRLIDEGFLDEERFARIFVSDKFRLNKWGRVKITQELNARDISTYCIDKAISEIGEEDYTATLTELAEKKSGTVSGASPFEKREKVARFLVGKGFETDLIWPVVKSQLPD